MTDDDIRSLSLEGISQLEIAKRLGITRWRVRVALADFRPAAAQGENWFDYVDLATAGAKYRNDPEQLELMELAMDVACWLDARGYEVAPFQATDGDTRKIVGPLDHIIHGIRDGMSPLTRIHVGRVRRLMAEIEVRT